MPWFITKPDPDRKPLYFGLFGAEIGAPMTVWLMLRDREKAERFSSKVEAERAVRTYRVRGAKIVQED